MLGYIAVTVGDHEPAAVQFRRFCDLAEAGVSSGFLQTFAPLLGRSLCVLGRHEEAEPLAQLGRSLDETEQDLYTQALWRQVQALVHASRDQHAEAMALAREAVAIMEPTDALSIQGDAFCDLAEVLAAAGRVGEAAEAYEQALERYERKKNLAMVAQVEPRLEALREGVRPA
jgi:tetratricopeptide (TPR) repeat protein